MQFAKFVVTRIIAYVLVIWIGITVVFFVPRFMPSDPVESMLGRIMSQGAYMEAEPGRGDARHADAGFRLGRDAGGAVLRLPSPHLRHARFRSLAVDVPDAGERIDRAGAALDAGAAADVDHHRLDRGHTIGLLAGYKSRWISSRTLEIIAIFVYPIPYYITALILIILFIHINPIFPLFFSVRGDAWSPQFISSAIYNSILPALSIVIVGFGWWVLSMKALSSSISEEDFVYFAKLKGAGEGRIMTAYVLRNAILPQVTVLALQIGAIFNGALITEILFSYPGLGTMTYSAVLQADYNLLMGTITISIIAVATSTLVIDLLYPFFDPRIRQR